MTTRTTKLDRHAVAELSKARRDPAWLRDRRLQGWDLALDLPLPVYERTRLRDADLEGFLPHGAGREVADADQLPAEARGMLAGLTLEQPLLVQHNSDAALARRSADLRERGVVFTDLETAAREHGDLVQRYLSQVVPVSDSRLSALNAALLAGGVFLYVPAGVEVTVPLTSLLWLDRPGVGVFDHTLIVAEPRSRVTVVQLAGSTGAAGALRCGLVEVVAAERARVRYCSLQALEANVRNLVVRRTATAPHSRVDWILGEFGSETTVSETVTRLDGEGSEATALGVFFGSGEQHLDLELRMHHYGRETTSDIMVRGIIRDRARSVYAPATVIHHGAFEANAFQRGNTLVLNPQARAHSIPQLVVVEDDVQGAGHAATISKVDPEQLFYLRSRGLDGERARRLIVAGFLSGLMERVPDALRPLVQQVIDGKMRA